LLLLGRELKGLSSPHGSFKSHDFQTPPPFKERKEEKKTKKKKKTITGGFSLDNKEIGETADAVDVVPHSTSVAI